MDARAPYSTSNPTTASDDTAPPSAKRFQQFARSSRLQGDVFQTRDVIGDGVGSVGSTGLERVLPPVTPYATTTTASLQHLSWAGQSQHIGNNALNWTPTYANNSYQNAPQEIQPGPTPGSSVLSNYQQACFNTSFPAVYRPYAGPMVVPNIPTIIVTHHNPLVSLSGLTTVSDHHSFHDPSLMDWQTSDSSAGLQYPTTFGYFPLTTQYINDPQFSPLNLAWRPKPAELSHHTEVVDLTDSADLDLELSDEEQELVCFGMITELGAQIDNNTWWGKSETPSTLPVCLDSSGSFTIQEHSNINGHAASESCDMIMELVESCLTLQAVYNPDSRPHGSNNAQRPSRPSQHTCTLSIILYGPQDMFDEVGDFAQSHHVFLQEPKDCNRDVLYCNPHSLPLLDGEEYSLTSSLDRNQTNLPLEDVPEQQDALEVLNVDENLEEAPQPTGVKTDLASHQKKALTFMVRREQGWNFDGSYPDIWHTLEGSQGTRYINQISRSPQNEVPPQFSGGIIADPMGFGKTLTMASLIARDVDEFFANSARSHGNPSGSYPGHGQGVTLVVVPLSLLPVWEEQFTEHLCDGTIRWRQHYGKTRLKSMTALTSCNVVLTTYQTLSSEWKSGVGSQHSGLFAISWRRIILDEAHVIRNPASQVAKAICALEAESRWAVTGTPLQNRLGDVATLLKFLRPYPYGDVRRFDEDIGQLWKQGDAEEAVKRLKRLMRCLVLRRPPATIDLPPRHDLVCPLDFTHEERGRYKETKACAIRRIEEALFSSTNTSSAYANALQQIDALRMICNLGTYYRPRTQKRVTQTQTMEWDNCAQQTFDSEREFGDLVCFQCKLTLEATESNNVDSGTHHQSMALFSSCKKFFCVACTETAARRSVKLNCEDDPPCPLARVLVNDAAGPGESATCLPLPRSGKMPTKIAALISQMKQSDQEGKCVVFSYWRSTLDLIQSALDSIAVESVRFDGRLSPVGRQASVDRFRKDPSVKVMLLTLSCGAVGLTLTVANRVYLMEPHWNPTVEEQALARVHRLGQKKEVTTIRFFVRDTLEQHVIDVQKKKKHLASILLSSGNEPTSDSNASRLEWLRSIL